MPSGSSSNFYTSLRNLNKTLSGGLLTFPGFNSIFLRIIKSVDISDTFTGGIIAHVEDFSLLFQNPIIVFFFFFFGGF